MNHLEFLKSSSFEYHYYRNNWKKNQTNNLFSSQFVAKRWLSHKGDWSSLAFYVIAFSGCTTNNTISLMLTFAGHHHEINMTILVYLKISIYNFWNTKVIRHIHHLKIHFIVFRIYQVSTVYFTSNNIWFVIHFRLEKICKTRTWT